MSEYLGDTGTSGPWESGHGPVTRAMVESVADCIATSQDPIPSTTVALSTGNYGLPGAARVARCLQLLREWHLVESGIEGWRWTGGLPHEREEQPQETAP